MSVEQTDIVDIIGTDRWTGRVTLTISDHLDWTDSVAHQTILQKKLNTYLAFVESGEILERYPEAKDKAVTFDIVVANGKEKVRVNLNADCKIQKKTVMKSKKEKGEKEEREEKE